MDEQKQSGWAFWCVVVSLSAPLFYVFSFGPACWSSSRWGGSRIVSYAYRPLTWTAEVTKSDTLMDAIQRYSELYTVGVWEWSLDPDNPGEAIWLDVSSVLIPPRAPGVGDPEGWLRSGLVAQ